MINKSIIKKYLRELPTNYLNVNIKFSQKEINYFENFNIKKDNNFEHFGNIDDLDDFKLNEYINDIGNNENINIFNNVVHKLLNTICKAYNTKFCWLAIRIRIPTNNYDIPRWHQDGVFFVNSDTLQAKFITVLKGPGTLFIKNKKINDIHKKYHDKKFIEYNKLNIFYDKEIEDKYRKILAKKYLIFKQHQVQIRQGLIFLNSQNKFPLVHSEPKIDVSRIFISILPGTEEDVINLKKRWNR